MPDTAGRAQSAPRAPAGWYLEPDRPGWLRYFDGAVWTDHRVDRRPPPVQPPPVLPRTPELVERSQRATRRFLWGFAALVVW